MVIARIQRSRIRLSSTDAIRSTFVCSLDYMIVANRMRRRVFVDVVVDRRIIATIRALRRQHRRVSISTIHCIQYSISDAPQLPEIQCFIGFTLNGNANGVGAATRCVGNCANITLNDTTIFLCDPINICLSLELINKCATYDDVTHPNQTGVTACCCWDHYCNYPIHYNGSTPPIPTRSSSITSNLIMTNGTSSTVLHTTSSIKLTTMMTTSNGNRLQLYSTAVYVMILCVFFLMNIM